MNCVFAYMHPERSNAEINTIHMAKLILRAEAAGLQWINSDAEKIRAVQDAMANEPPPPRTPREPKAAPVLDDGPLVLVETRKDLSQVKLPFETSEEKTSSRV